MFVSKQKYLPGVYNGLIVVSVISDVRVPNITIGNSGMFGNKAATASPLDSFSFFLNDLLRFLDFFLMSS